MRLLLNPFATRPDAPPPWRELAACDGADLDLFFPVGVAGPARWQISQATAICQGCPVREQCLEYALRTGQDHGIWGGLTPEERRRVRLEEIRDATNSRGA